MTQLSRPYQIALLAMGLLAAVWFVALRGHSAGTSSSSSPAPASAPAPSASSQAEKAAAPSPVYKGSAPGVEGLTRAIAKAHGAVAESQQNAKQLQEKSAQASSTTAAGVPAGASTAASQPKSSVTSQGSTATRRAARPKTASTGAGVPSTGRSKVASTAVKGAAQSASPSLQTTVEGELKQGKVVAILFWNPKASVDVAVRRELQAVGHVLGGKIAVHDARANQVGSFGSITRAVQVYQTPTILIVNKTGQTTTLTGLTDVFSIEQTIGEARQ